MLPFCSACNTESQGPGFVLRTRKQNPAFYFKLNEIKQELLLDEGSAVLQVQSRPTFNSSKFPSKPFIDREFPPEDHSLGTFENLHIDKWKRLSEIIPQPRLFGSGVQLDEKSNIPEPSVMALAACLACLAERQSILRSIFSTKELSPVGVYSLLMRCKSEIKEITVDDFVPINETGSICFTPNLTSSLDLHLIEKARAKAFGSYEKMIKQSQDIKACLQDLTCAPSYSYKTSSCSPPDLWLKIEGAVKAGHPCLALTSSHQHIQWGQVQLTPNHYYTILDAQTLTHKLGSQFKVLKLRNPFKVENYNGQGSLLDTLFWQQIESGQQKSHILSNVGSKQGVIYMLFNDYIKYFGEVFVNQWQENPKYFYQPLRCQSKARGNLYQLLVKREGTFNFSLQQNDMFNEHDSPIQDEGWSRVTILLARNKSSQFIANYEYVDGLLKYNQQTANLCVSLPPGSYVLYVKVDPTVSHCNLPAKANLIVYSSQLCYLKESSQSHHPDFLKLVFSEYARNNKRQFYNQDQMWSSWKLFGQCGYGYIGFGNNPTSKHAFLLTIDQQQLLNQNYKLKKPFKGKGKQQIHVSPGHQTLILLRVLNSNVKDINFPPPITIEIQSLPEQSKLEQAL